MPTKVSTLLFNLFILLSLSACVVGNRVGHSGHDVYATFGNISVFDGETAGDLSNNSGNITIGKNAKIKSADVTNGNIDIGESSEAYALVTVNGNIVVGKNVTVNHDVKSTNGDIDIQASANIGNNIVASNGDVSIKAGVVVLGDIIFEDSFLSSYAEKIPTLTIAEGATISGNIRLEKEVHLSLPKSFNLAKVIRNY